MNKGGWSITEFLNRCWFEVNLCSIAHNIAEIRSKLQGNAKIISVLKGNGYGHGALEMAKAVVKSGVEVLAVATLAEAMELRRGGIAAEILILGYTPIEDIDYIIKNTLTQTVFSLDYATQLNKAAEAARCTVYCELKIDTGMKRIGFSSEKALFSDITEALRHKNLHFKGIYSHFATADENTQGDIDFAQLQITNFSDVCQELEALGICLERKHICNSSGTMRFPDAHFDFCRTGSLVVGLNTAQGIAWDLRPAGALKAVITMIKQVKKGESVSYCRTFFADRDMLVATIACGYADGYPRSLSNKAKVELQGILAPVVGTVCMDQMMIDVTDIPSAKVGDHVTLFGSATYPELGILPVANLAGSVYVELMARIGSRIPRVYIHK